MRRIKNMKTLNVHRAALDLAVLDVGSVRNARPVTRTDSTANAASAIDRQLDEIQRTFGARWEW